MNWGLPLLLLALVSCQTATPTYDTPAINFGTDPAILRGTWSGTVTGQVLRLDLSATYDTSRQYKVSGSGTLNAVALTVTGMVTGGSVHTYLWPQLSPLPETANLTLQRGGQADLVLSCTSYGSASSSDSRLWNCRRMEEDTATFTLTKGTP